MRELSSPIATVTRFAGSPRLFERRAQSETIGVILLTAVIVVLVTGFGVVYLGGTGGQAGGDPPLFDAEVEASALNLSITHAGGESLPLAELDVVVSVDGDRTRFAVDPSNVTGDDRFEPSDRFERHHDLGGGRMEVLVVHTGSNAILYREYLDVMEGDAAKARFASAPADPEPGETVSFDASASDRLGEIRTYAWDWDGDGRCEANRSTATEGHAFAARAGST